MTIEERVKLFDNITQMDYNMFKIICPCCKKEFYEDRKGVNNRLNRNKIKERFGACSRSCSAKLHRNSEEEKQLREKRAIEKYGSIEERNRYIKEKQKEGIEKKYPTEEAWRKHIKEVQEKTKETYLKKFGVEHNMLNPESVKKNQEKRKKTIAKMSKERKEEWTTKRMESYKKNNSFFGNKRPTSNTHSKEANEFISLLLEEDFFKGKKCYYGDNEKKFEGESNYSHYFLDFFDEDDKIGIEFYGDYWHASPAKFKDEDVINYKGREQLTASQVREKDEKRKKYIEDKYGIKIYVVWENEYLKDKNKTIKELMINLEK